MCDGYLVWVESHFPGSQILKQFATRPVQPFLLLHDGHATQLFRGLHRESSISHQSQVPLAGDECSCFSGESSEVIPVRWTGEEQCIQRLLPDQLPQFLGSTRVWIGHKNRADSGFRVGTCKTLS